MLLAWHKRREIKKDMHVYVAECFSPRIVGYIINESTGRLAFWVVVVRGLVSHSQLNNCFGYLSSGTASMLDHIT